MQHTKNYIFVNMYDLIEMLRARGMIHDITPGTASQLQKETTAGYMGFDPTAASLHVGNLAALLLLRHFQLAGHQPRVLLGGATGMIGDPSGKLAERSLLSEEEVHHNQLGIQKQLGKFLDFSPGKHQAVLLNNLDWLGHQGLLAFLQEVGKHIPVGYMLAKDTVKNRLERGISFTEFTYTLLQAYDFYHLYTTQGIKLQIGGADQWGNLTAGIELIRRKTGQSAFAFTTPLITKADGTKFGKSEGGNIWLDPKMTSPYDFYQFWLNITDEEACRFAYIFTMLENDHVDALIQAHEASPHLRIIQRLLAKDLTILIHSRADYERAARATLLIFEQGAPADLLDLVEADFRGLGEMIPQIEVPKAELDEAKHPLALITRVTRGVIFTSQGEARRMIQERGVKINKVTVKNPYQEPDWVLLEGRYLLVQRGRKHHYLVKGI